MTVSQILSFYTSAVVVARSFAHFPSAPFSHFFALFDRLRSPRGNASLCERSRQAQGGMLDRTLVGQGARGPVGFQLVDRAHRRRGTNRGRAQDTRRLRRLPRRVPALLRLLEEVRRPRGQARGSGRRRGHIRARNRRLPLQRRPVDPQGVARHLAAT